MKTEVKIQSGTISAHPAVTNQNSSGKICELHIQETAETQRILSKEALKFLTSLEEKFGPQRHALLQARKARQEQYDGGDLPDFNPETAEIRTQNWKIDPVPAILEDRRVEITGPVDRKMMINALNSEAKVFMGDFEDATSPTFDNILNGQINVQDYTKDNLAYDDPKTGKHYQVAENPALLIIRPRGLHLEESHLTIDNAPLSASFVDFGLHIFHNGKILTEKGLGPFYYIPKLESHLEARLWNDLFIYAQDYLNIPQGTIKATVLIETLPAAFEMDEILYELRHHTAGLNCGRWDYIFSYIKTLRNHSDFILPDRAAVTMDQAFLKAYCVHLIHTCHKRGAHAMGGMAAQIPIKNDEDANKAAIEKVCADKIREANLYHDGTWVAHPALVKPAMEIFDKHMPGANNLDKECPEKPVSSTDMLNPHKGEITESGVRTNIAVALEYMTAWLNGRGAVPINHLMEDAATAEICRMQLWQWLKFNCQISSEQNENNRMNKDFFTKTLEEEFEKLQLIIKNTMSNSPEQNNTLKTARDILKNSVLSKDFQDFLSLPLYRELTKNTAI